MSERIVELQLEADSLGVKYSKNMKEDALAKRIEEFKSSNQAKTLNSVVIPMGGEPSGPEFRVGSVKATTYTVQAMTVIRN